MKCSSLFAIEMNSNNMGFSLSQKNGKFLKRFVKCHFIKQKHLISEECANKPSTSKDCC